ncbi:hypothetical protein CEUSTIGMA_g158.t1 [Chlamydomonas eustigma]|uniref:Uncharacterized protein n=1 Tax=Chlamydomonas eustigma TaxID=1157962 RepID=A0A250WPW9_9CHLO|nr:hypothetical protein CEUSTIGMA_g158.t1 [Chlamydomonas eustigma]|eukprot:GAX72702.1 hypothetical protein CEUSTIGMA_g158.t1 [Chlamydomonas eustigma]
MTSETAENHMSQEDSGSKKGVPWSELEHAAFLKGLRSLGKGNWRGISRMFVPSRSPTQVASHAQKYFLRLNGCTKRRSRFSGLEQVSRCRVKQSSPVSTSSSVPTSSGDSQNQDSDKVEAMPTGVQHIPMPPMLQPAPHMMHSGLLPPMLFNPGGAPIFAPLFFPPATFAKPGFSGMMIPLMMGLPPPHLAFKGLPIVSKEEGCADSSATLSLRIAALCKPEARQASTACFEAVSLLGLPRLGGPAPGCHMVLRASAFSAFRPTGGQVTAA